MSDASAGDPADEVDTLAVAVADPGSTPRGSGSSTDTRTLIVERVDESDVPYCLPTREPQYEGCYRYRLEPALAPGETFDVEVA